MEDPYLFLENINSSEVLGFINAKNRLFRGKFGVISDKLLPRILQLYNIPIVVQLRCSKNGLYILARTVDRYTVYRVWESNKIIVLDSKSLGDNVVIQWINPSPSGDLIAFAYSLGTDAAITKIIDVESGEEIDRLEGVISDINWIDRYRYYYVRFYREGKTPDGVEAPAERVLLRETSGREEVVFGSGFQSKHMINLEKSKTSNRVFITVTYGWIRSKVYAGLFEDPSTWGLVYDPGEALAYPIDYVDGRYLVAVYDGNGLGRVVASRGGGHIEEIIGEDPMYPLQEAVVYLDKIVASYLVNASSRLRLYKLNGEFIKEITFDKPGTVSQLQNCVDYCAFLYTSFDIPYRVYTIKNDGITVVDGISANNVCAEEHYVESFDGTPIHVFHVYNCSRRSNKAVLTGYGGFGISLTPRYLDYMLLLIEDGVEYFIANIRGGGEYGRKWHEAGRREKRENVYKDFLSVIKWLKNQNYSVVIHGRSNGGLLCGVIYVRYPDLIDGAVIGYPLLDMLRYHKLYIGSLWMPEYGDPDNHSDRDYLSRISPYHNLRGGARYPPCLIYTGLSDDRVHPGHALKFSAKLNELGVENYLRVETASGHIGADPMISGREKADILAFIYYVLQLDEKPR